VSGNLKIPQPEDPPLSRTHVTLASGSARFQ